MANGRPTWRTSVLAIRHGESEWNAVGRWQGQADPPLTDAGMLQAVAAAQVLGTFDGVYASSLQRAADTAAIIAEAIGVGPVQLLDDLLSAFVQDVQYTAANHWYTDHAELMQYCSLSANPVGRLLLHLYGITDLVALKESDAICTALQLINFWQDAGRDMTQRRYYLPLDLMAEHGVTPLALLEHKDTEKTMLLIASCADIAWATMQKGLKLPARVQRQLGGFDGWRAGLELRCVIQGGLRILDKTRALRHRTIGQRPKLGRWDACVVMWRALRM